ncbi:terminal uridylyltransferase 7-like [Huso huso]|uniref:Terminal uridylyltransferase 7-like n=1 Tax=Huso huso TaxID=61971 RepID=A0ABR1AB58_HUSHU
MEDSSRTVFLKKGKEKGSLAEEAESWRSPLRQDCSDYGRGLSNKAEMGSHRKISQASYGSSPRKDGHGILSNSSVGFKKRGQSPGGRQHDDGFRKLPAQDDHHTREENWRERSNSHEFTRERKDSMQGASEDLSRCADDGSKGNKRKSKQRRRNHLDREEDQDSPVIDESVLSEKELLGLHQAEERLSRDDIFRLKRHPRNCPNAKYSCKLCDVLIESISSAHKHIKEKWHKKKVKEKREEELLTALLPPSQSQVKAIGAAIGKVVEEHGLSDEDVIKRKDIVTALEKVIKCLLPECSLRLYGSSCTKFGFKDSDIDIDIQFPAHMHQPDVLLLVQESLHNSKSFIDLEADFHARVPVVVCKEKQSGLLCKMSAGNDNAYLTTDYMAALAELEPRLTPLVTAFRYWAKICHIDCPEEGGLPPYVIALMVIYFLQQRKEPVLPVYLGLWIEGFSLNKLMDFRLIGVEDSQVLWEYNPSLEKATHTGEEFVNHGKAPLTFDPDHQCEVALGQLWVELFRFYSLEFNMPDYVISIRIKEVISRELKDWPKKRIAIEDPYSSKRNVARTLNSQLMYEYILHCLKTTYKYFALPQKKQVKPNKQNHKDLEAEVIENIELQRRDPGQRGNIPPSPNELHLIQSKLHDLNVNSSQTRTDLNGKSKNHVPNNIQGVDCPRIRHGSDSFAEEEVASEKGIDDLDCVIEEIILEDPDGSKPNSDEQSENEEQEQAERSTKLDANQRLGEESENGDPINLTCFSMELENETESPSDSEGCLNPGLVDSDDFGLDDTGRLDKEDEDPGSNEELDESLNTFLVSKQRHLVGSINSEEEDDEEDTYHRDHLDSVTMEDELDNIYTASGEDILSEDDEHFTLEAVTRSDQWGHKKENETSGRVGTSNKRDLDGKVKNDPVFAEDSRHDNDLVYEFSKLTFTRGKLPTIACSLCRREGHLKRDCPEDFKKVELEPLPPMTPKFLKILNQVCNQCYKDFSPDQIEEQVREYILQNLEQFVKQEFDGAKLSLFGSSKNGFGFKQSDLDVCMTFEGKETAEGLDCIRIIENLAKVLRKHPGLRNILPITTAKVPIVKFFHMRTGLEGDISLYNTLALHNTRLLAAYASIDPRVKYLCYTMKVFSKVCDIGDASRGSLSSYAYTLMVLYFLQQRKQPVIPVLQEIYDGPGKPEEIVDGWNVYFFDDLSNLPNRWPQFGKNTESVGELWLGMLQFYTEEFDFKEHVISIRRKKLLTTFKKQWTSKYIVIEDPFDLNHNLGAGLSRKMTNFIMKAFINGRRVFGTPVKVFPSEYPTKMEYFFDPEVLTEGELAPNDRCCRICGKIGHFMKDCPLRRKLRKRDRGYDDDRYQRRNLEDRDMSNLGSSPQKTRQEQLTYETGRDRTPRQWAEKWSKQEDRELREKRCFICGSEGHIKKECPQYKGSAGVSKPGSISFSTSPSAPSNLKNSKANQGTSLQKQKVFLSPQTGFLVNKHMTQGRSAQKRNQQD